MLAVGADRRDTECMAGNTRRPAAQRGGERDERVRSLLHARGLRCTTPRLAVLAVLGEAGPDAGHLTVAQIHRRLIDQQREVDLATVYRTVSTLVDLGVLHALTVDERGMTYGLAEEPHHHAVCTRCGSMIEVPAEQLSTALTQASLASRFALSERAGLTLHGLCPECRSQSA
jgi:Fur family ferric uptake transcriptional regulator